MATCPTVVTTLKKAVLRKNRPNGAAFQASDRFAQRGWAGSSGALGLMISPFVLSAEASIHSSGNTTTSTEIATSV